MKKTILLLTIIIFSLIVLIFRFKSGNYEYLTFSDTAKFADVGRNLITNNEYTSNFSNFVTIETGLKNISPVSTWIPPITPISAAFFMKIFGVNDFSLVLSTALLFILLIIAFYSLSQRLFGILVGFLASVALILNINFLGYALLGGAETLFTLEIILAIYLFLRMDRASNLLGYVVLVFMYFTKAQAIIYIFGLLLLILLKNYSFKKAWLYFTCVILLGGVFFILTSKQGLFALTQQPSGVAVSDSLRGAVQNSSIVDIFKKIFYNLYNFYRLMPQIMNPYLWALFVIGLFRWYKSRTLNALKISTIFMVGLTFLVTAATIPFFRYIHPVVPLIYLFGVEMLVWIVNQISNFQFPTGRAGQASLISNKLTIFKFQIVKQQFINLTSLILLLVLAVGQTLGVIFLDSRFERKSHNVGKPPVYVQLSYVLKDNTDKNAVVVTNLDTWGSWYGERKTVWFPLEPKQLIDVETNEIPFDAIYLTSYLIDDENYYMGESWRMIFNNPDDPIKWTCDGCQIIAEEFVLKGEYGLVGSENYQNEDARAILLIKKN